MRLHLREQSELKKPFLLSGVVAALLLSGWYLWENHRKILHPDGRTLPDPVWVRFVNIALILFICIYAANLLRRIVEFVRKGGKR